MPMAKNSKKITIKPFRKPPQLPPDFYLKTSTELLQATAGLLVLSTASSSSGGAPKQTSSSLQHAYTLVVNLVSHQFGPKLYADLVSQLKTSAATILPSDIHHQPDGGILDYLQVHYPKYINYLLLARHVFMALDRPYIWDQTNHQALKRASNNQGTILEVGLWAFSNRLQELGYTTIMFQDWSRLLWAAFLQDSNNQTNPLLESTMNIWKDLGMARHVIHQIQPILQQNLSQVSKEWQEESNNQDKSYSAEAFLTYVYQQWQYVSNNWPFLPKTFLRTLLEVHLLEPHLNNTFLLKNIDISHLDHCQRLWQLAGRLDQGLPRVLEQVCLQTKQRGVAIVSQPQTTCKVAISSLLEMHTQLTALKERVGDKYLLLKPVWTEIMNQTPLIAEWLAKYIDLEFKNFKSEQSLEQLLFLFCHIQAKDIFEAFYRKDLAKRLLLGRISSMDLERQFVTLLKSECGAGYTSKLEGMFQDVEWSRESTSLYKASNEYTSNPQKVDFEVQILTTGYWPVYPQFAKLALTPDLSDPRNLFWDYYKSKYQGRKIVWQYALGQCMVKFVSPKNKTYEFICNLCMALVLVCFNQQDEWTFSALMTQIGLDDREEMVRTLWALFHGKEQARILKRIKAGNSNNTDSSPTNSNSNNKGGGAGSNGIDDDDLFCVNEKFSCNLRRIRIPNMLKKESKEERDKVVEAVSRDRLYLIDAVLVRILKARKTILHQQLIPQVLEQVKVPAQPADIKKRIESLIEREYMERDETDRNRYNYLA